jgi:hypothetical protein
MENWEVGFGGINDNRTTAVDMGDQKGLAGRLIPDYLLVVEFLQSKISLMVVFYHTSQYLLPHILCVP